MLDLWMKCKELGSKRGLMEVISRHLSKEAMSWCSL